MLFLVVVLFILFFFVVVIIVLVVDRRFFFFSFFSLRSFFSSFSRSFLHFHSNSLSGLRYKVKTSPSEMLVLSLFRNYFRSPYLILINFNAY